MHKYIKVLIICLLSIVLLCSCNPKSKQFKNAKNTALEIAGQIHGGKNSFSIDTKASLVPFDEMSSMQRNLHTRMEKQAIEAIINTNITLGFDSTLYDKMMETTEADGKKYEENESYRVSWAYAYNDGLEVTYELK